jgi:transcriptional regulator with XRE-family HTH domain
VSSKTIAPEYRAQIGAALRETRMRRGLSLGDLSVMLGNYDTRSLMAVEGGVNGISVGVLFRLAETLQCSWNEILGPPPGSEDQDVEWHAGYRACVGDAAIAIRDLLSAHSNGR